MHIVRLPCPLCELQIVRSLAWSHGGHYHFSYTCVRIQEVVLSPLILLQDALESRTISLGKKPLPHLTSRHASGRDLES